MNKWGWKRRKANPLRLRCENCGKYFYSVQPSVQKYCSRSCQNKAYRKRQPIKQLPPVRVLVKRCEQCNRTFQAKNASARYCSRRCSQKAYRARKKKK